MVYAAVTAFIFAKHLLLTQSINCITQTTNIAKLVSQAWKDLSAEERGKWEEMARKDKMRYEVEKSMYTGPWKVPAKKLSQKDPSAPKRPMSAFLAFSHSKRAAVKAENATMNNAEISRVLAQMWKDAKEEEKKEFIDAEYELRQKYLSEIAVWREKTETELSEQRKQREEIALQTVAARGAHGADPMAGEEQRHYAAQATNSNNNANSSGAAAEADYYSSSQQQYYNGYPGPRGGNPAMDAYYNGGPPPPNTVTPPSVAEYFEGGYAEYGYGAGGPYGGGYYYPPPPHMPPPESGSAAAAAAAAYSARGGGEYPYPPPPPPYGAGAYGGKRKIEL